MYNVGTEIQTTINELCELILELKNSELKVKYNPYSEDDARALVKNRIWSRKLLKMNFLNINTILELDFKN